jgi:hypothetical protein
MDAERWALALLGAAVGSIGWLLVGMYLQRRDADRRARSALRAVYFELELNAVNARIAREHRRFAALSRANFDRTLPDVAMLLAPDALGTLVTAYHGHAGYEQLATEEGIPPAVANGALSGIVDAHDRALAVVRKECFPGDRRPATAASAFLEGQEGGDRG